MLCLTSLGRASAFAANTTFVVEYQTPTNALMGYIIKSPLFNTMHSNMFQPLMGYIIKSPLFNTMHSNMFQPLKGHLQGV